jgi:hypothetical protein
VAVVDGREVLRGNSLARLLREVGGYEGEIAHPTTGEAFPVSLAPWAECDPQTTWLTVRFESDLPPIDWDELTEID